MGTDLGDLDPSVWSRTGEQCAQCDEHLIYDEEIILLQVVRPEVHGTETTLVPLEGEDGDFLYEIYYLHFTCWEGILEELKEEIEDAPPVIDEWSVIACDACGSSIRENETCAALTLGELRISKRAPTSTGRGFNLFPLGAPDVLCVHCMATINEEHLTCWEQGIGQEGECYECQHVRCWRGFDCDCTCHQEE